MISSRELSESLQAFSGTVPLMNQTVLPSHFRFSTSSPVSSGNGGHGNAYLAPRTIRPGNVFHKGAPKGGRKLSAIFSRQMFFHPWEEILNPHHKFWGKTNERGVRIVILCPSLSRRRTFVP